MVAEQAEDLSKPVLSNIRCQARVKAHLKGTLGYDGTSAFKAGNIDFLCRICFRFGMGSITVGHTWKPNVCKICLYSPALTHPNVLPSEMLHLGRDFRHLPSSSVSILPNLDFIPILSFIFTCCWQILAVNFNACKSLHHPYIAM